MCKGRVQDEQGEQVRMAWDEAQDIWVGSWSKWGGLNNDIEML